MFKSFHCERCVKKLRKSCMTELFLFKNSKVNLSTAHVHLSTLTHHNLFYNKQFCLRCITLRAAGDTYEIARS